MGAPAATLWNGWCLYSLGEDEKGYFCWGGWDWEDCEFEYPAVCKTMNAVYLLLWFGCFGSGSGSNVLRSYCLLIISHVESLVFLCQSTEVRSAEFIEVLSRSVVMEL